MPTLKDVARHAGVSKSTVSRVFNEPEKVKPSTREAVQEAVDELGYFPSRVARRLRTENGQTSMIGLVITDIQNPFFADLVRGVEDVVSEKGIALLLSNSDEDLERQQVCLNTLRTERVDGVIVPPVDEHGDDLKQLVENGIPVVCVDRRVSGLRVDTVVSDNREGTRAGMAHLIGLGYERIGFVGGISRISTTRERRKGYEQALREHGLDVVPDLIREGDSRLESGRRLTLELLNLPEPPRAIFAGNNLMSLGALVAIHERGLRIPEDVAIIGFDDVAWALALNPPLTVIYQSGYEMGRRAAQMLLQRLSNPKRSPTVEVLIPELIVRQSCGSTTHQ